MKQTNNALTFLMAQYRAIFKNAYFKGLTSALLVTAGLAAAQGAQAATLADIGVEADDDDSILNIYNDQAFITNTAANSGATTTISNGEVLFGYKGSPLKSIAGNLTLKSGASLSSYSSNVSQLQIETSLTLEGATLTVNNNSVITGSGSVGLSGTFAMRGGSGDLTKGALQFKDVTLSKGATLEIGGAMADTANAIAADWNKYTSGIIAGSGSNTQGKITISDATINMKESSAIAVFSQGATSGGTFTITDGEINLSGTGFNTKYDAASDADAANNKSAVIYGDSGSTLNFAGGTVNVAEGKVGEIRGGIINLKAGTFTIEDDGQLLIGAASGATANANVQLNGATITNNGGELWFGNPDNITVTGISSGSEVNAISGTIDNTDGVTHVASGSILELKGTTLNNDGGVLNIKSGGTVNVLEQQNTTKNTDGVVTLGGTVNVDGILNVGDGSTLNSTLIIAEDATLTTKAASAGSSEGLIDVKSGSTIVVNAKQLAAFLDEGNQVDINNDGNLTGDKSGAFSLSGTADFRDAVTLSDFEFDSSAAAGKINLDAGAKAKATTVTIEKALENTTNKLAIEATNLVVNITDPANSATINADGELNFKEATVTSSLSFNASGADVLSVGNTYYLEAATPNTDEAGKVTSYTAADGTITGQDIELVGTGGSLKVNAGHWTAAQEIILGNGGRLTVKVQPADGSEHKFDTDSTLTLTKGLTFDLDDGSSTVEVSNSSAKTVDRPTAALDLTAGLKVKNTTGSSNTGAIKVSGDGAEVYLNAADTNALLSDNSDLNKISVTVENEGALNVAGAISANFNDLASGTGAAGKIHFTGDGEFNVDNLTLTGDSSNARNGSNTTLAIGSGVINANELRLVDEINPMTDKNGNDLSKITVTGGDLNVAQTLYSNAHNLQLDGGSLNLATTEAGAQGRIETLDRITLGTSRTSGAELNVDAGKWLAQGTDVFVNTGSKFTVGGALQADNTVAEASLQARDLKVGANALVNIKDNGSATFETLDASTTLTGNIKIENGSLTITGRAGDMDGDKDTTENHHGMLFGDKNDNKSVFIVDGTNANLAFGQEATLTFFDASKQTTASGDGTGSGDGTNGSGDAGVSGDKTVVVDASAQGKLLVRAGGTVSMDFDGYQFTLDQVQDLKKKLFNGTFRLNSDTRLDGFFNIGDAEITDLNIVDNKISWAELEDISDIVYDTYNTQLSQATVTGVNASSLLGGNYGAIQTANNVNHVSLASNLTLNNAAGNSGNFVGTVDGTPVDVLVNTGLNFIANGSGTLADVTLNQTDARENDRATFIAAATDAANTINIGDVNASGSYSANTLFATSGAGTVKVNNVNVGAVEFVGTTNEVAGSLKANNMDFVNARVTAQDITLNGNNFNADNAQVIVNGDLKLENVANNLMAVQHGATVSVLGNFTATDGDIRVGSAQITENEYNNLVATYGADVAGQYIDRYRNLNTNTSSTGVFEVRGETRLNGSTVFADPDYGNRATLVSFNTFKNSDAKNNYLGTLDGNLIAGKNSIIGVGFASVEALNETIAKLQYQDAALFDENGSLDQNKIGSIVYVNGQLNVAAGNTIALNSNVTHDTVEQIEADFVRQLANVPALPTPPVDDGEDGAGDTGSGDVVTQDDPVEPPVSRTTPDLLLGSNTALIIADRAFDAASKNTTDRSAAIKFEASHAEVYAQAGAKVLVDGTNFSLSDVDIFDDAEGDGVKLTTSDRKGLVVESLNGWFTYTLADGDAVGTGVQLDFTEPDEPETKLEMSEPVYKSIRELSDATVEVVPPSTDTPDAGDANDGAETQAVAAAATEKRYQVVQGTFLATALSETKTGREIEQAARLGVYAGTAQAALTAAHTTTEALNSRMGIGAQGANLTMADNAQGATLWLTPVYKSSDSDGFGAQGVDYGADLDLYGVALGADYTLANGVTVGAAFNIGSGDADGEGIASGISNDFDYYGFSVYGGLTNGPLSLVADISYTTVDNEFDTNANFTSNSYKLSGTADSSTLTIGVTAQYEYKMDNLTVAPHGGLRYTNLKLDDYDVKAGDRTVAQYDSDSLSFISIPVGVTISSEIINGSWTIKPAADLTLTANLGDDELEGTTTWADTDKGYGALKTSLATEVLDGFTYGVSAGVSAQSGNFNVGVGVNYTGSSNTDEFGINANARFVF